MPKRFFHSRINQRWRQPHFHVLLVKGDRPPDSIRRRSETMSLIRLFAKVVVETTCSPPEISQTRNFIVVKQYHETH